MIYCRKAEESLWLEKESWEQLLRAIRRVLLTLLHLCSCIQALGDIPQIGWRLVEGGG